MFREFTKLLCGAAVAMVMVAGAALAEPTRGGSIVWPVASAPRHFNSAVQSGIATAMPAAQIFASPLRFDADWKPQPYLAEKWEVAPDGLSVTLTLVDGAKFHDGKPVTSEDVAFSVMAVKENHPFQTMLAPVTGVDTPDPRTAVIRLAHPHPAILLAMSPALMPILPKHVYGDGQDLKSHPANLKPVGSGPFKFEEYREGEYITLVRNDDFFIKDRPYLDRIVMRIIPDGPNRTIAMERHEGHVMPFEERIRDINRMKRQDGLVVTDQGYAGIGPINWLAFNLERPPFDNKKVRQAIGYAIDKEFVTKALMEGVGVRALGPIAPGGPFSPKDVEPYKLDLDKANKLLDEAGFPRKADGTRFTMNVDYIPGFALLKTMAEYMKPQLAKVGIKAEPRPSPDFPTWASRVSNHDFDATMDVVFNWGDPVIGVHRTYLSSNIRKGVIWSNTQSYRNPRVDELLTAAGKEQDEAKRKALYDEFQKIVVDDAPIVFIAVSPYHTVFDKRLANLPTTIWGTASPLDETYWAQKP